MAKLSEISTTAPNTYTKDICITELQNLKEELYHLQNQLFAQKKSSILVVFQGVDTSGKDSTIRHVFSSMNPMGVNVKSFKKPTEEEKNHDFMWRIFPHFPAKGTIQIFNRSHYEDIIMPQILGVEVALEKRLEFIRQTEDHLTRHGTHIIKFFLHVSKTEQADRINERKTNPKKRYKYTPADELAAGKYPIYQNLYDALISGPTNLPWQIIPADNKWYRNYKVAKDMVELLKSIIDNNER